MSRKLTMVKLLFKKDGFKKAEYLKQKNIFKSMGDKCYYHPFNIPSEPYLVSIGNNVIVSSGVRLITHDMSYALLNNYSENKFGSNNSYYNGSITIGDNVMIGADSIILPNVEIGNNVVIAAGSVVTKNIPSDSVVGGGTSSFYRIVC